MSKFTRRSMAVAGVLCAAVLLLIVWLLWKPQSVSAAEILARAANLTALQAYEGVIVRGNGQADAYTQWEEHVWFQAPDNLRIEDYSPLFTGSSAPPENLIARSTPTIQISPGHFYLQSLKVSNGVDAWSFDPRSNMALRQDPDEFDALYPSIVFPTYDLTTSPDKVVTSLQMLLDKTRADFRDVKLLGTETVAGRQAYKIEVTPNSDDVTELSAGTHIVLWIDQETYIQLGAEIRGIYDVLLTHSMFASIRVNQPTDASVFTFNPPGSVTVADARPKVNPTSVELSQAWQALAAKVPFKLFVPSEVPAYLKPKSPIAIQGVEQHYSSKNSAVALSILQLAWSDKNVRFLGKPILINGYKAYYWEQFNIHQLNLVRDGTLISMTVRADVTQDDLIKIASSLQEVSKTVTPVP